MLFCLPLPYSSTEEDVAVSNAVHILSPPCSLGPDQMLIAVQEIMSQSSRSIGVVALRLLRGPASSAEAQALTIACQTLDFLVNPRSSTAAGSWTSNSILAGSTRRWLSTGMHVSGTDGRQLNAISAGLKEEQHDAHGSSFASVEDAGSEDEAEQDDPHSQKLRQQILQTALTFVVRSAFPQPS